ncbi:aldehyde dehydrogenase [Halegenticoccus soli]|uniref:aldehyde dehydrogenase n=1 Tax=Halegenticoccus soli TaxID=1985678 RepID=UPI000C6E3AFD|nr:aldehyde dehydrogenase [Halegenticoccus soli]
MSEENQLGGQYIAGEWRVPSGTESIEVRNPTTEEVITDIPNATSEEIDSAINAAGKAQIDWGRRPARERGELVREVAELMMNHQSELADLIVKEQGKPRNVALGEIEASADLCEYMAEWDRRIEGDILPGDTRRESIHLQRHPLGVIAGIIPWNYPIAVFIRKFAPALVAGNTLVAKPSEETPLATLRLTELIDEEIDLPDGVLNIVTGGGEVGTQLVSSDSIDMISMTGSVETGKAIMRAAADNLTKVSLELGGKAPVIVWKDADIDQAVEDILTARITNTGQVCTCAERVYVHGDVREEFEERYVEAAKNVTLGQPEDNPDMGPQVNERELEKTEAAVERARNDGAEVLLGGSRPSGNSFERGYWYEPTVITDVNQDMDIMQNEVFGPVTPIMEIDSLENAVEYANDSRYGLSSYVFTDSYRTAMRVAEELEFGETYINRTLGESWHGHHIGWNESGLGGEDGKYGFLKYTQLKTVYHNYN